MEFRRVLFRSLTLEKLWRNILLDRNRFTVPHPDKHDILKRSSRVLARLNDAGNTTGRPLRQDGQAFTVLVEHPTVIRTGDSALVMASSDERRVGQECVSPCRSRRSPDH